jgi:hypothetical protein
MMLVTYESTTPMHRAAFGNGAHEALVNTMAQTIPMNSSILADEILIGLYMRGFKVVPITDTE